MADVNANIHIGIDATQALGQLRALQSQISQFNRSVVAGNAAAAATQASMASSLASMVGATGQFNTSIRTMETGVSSLGTAFDKGTLSGRQFFRYAASQMPGLTRAFRGLGVEQARMAELATDRVKRLQTQYVDLGKDVRGMQKVMAIQPKNLATGYATDLAIAQQRQQLFNRALQMGSTGLVNWGKNTQWAGRQLMVGFTVPLTIAAGAAAKFFMELDKASMQFRRVYGDMNTSTEETYKNLEAIKSLGVEYTKYGLAVSDVIDIGARAAATGAQNEDLMAATEQTLRLATLGQMEYGRALDATISLQTAFGISAEELGNKINFLNAVENQTVLTMEDMALAVPRVAPVIKGLGGDVEDLAVFMTALREGGVTAEQGANALKSGLASLINPTNRAQESLNALGINIKEIVQTNRGDLMGTVKAFGDALNSLDEFERQQALEQVFGKYQYARLGALFKNISNDASQSAQAMKLAGASVEELRGMAEKELSIVSETVTNQFLGAVERLKVAIAPIGEIFLKAVTPVINAVSAIADAFNGLPDGVKTAIGAVVGIVGGLAPVFLMGIGLIGNAIGNGIKFILTLRNGVKSLAATLTGSASNFKYQSGAALDSAAAMASLEGRVSSLTGDLLMQEGAVSALTAAYGRLAGAASAAAASMPRGFAMPGVASGGRPAGLIPPIRMATGGLVPGRGNKDTIPALLTPGESVVTKEATARYGPIISAMNAGNLPGFAGGMTGEFAHIGGRLSMRLGDLVNMEEFSRAFTQSAQRNFRAMASTLGEDFAVNLYRGLGFTSAGRINRSMATTGVSGADFLKDWDKRGLDRWSTSLKNAGLKLNEVSGSLGTLDNHMRRFISRYASMTGGPITDRVVERAYLSAIKKVGPDTPLAQSFGRLSTTITEARVNISKSVAEASGARVRNFTRRDGTVSSKQYVDLPGATRVKVGGERFPLSAPARRSGVLSTESLMARGAVLLSPGGGSAVRGAAGAAGATAARSMNAAARASIGAASPATQGTRLVSDYVAGMELGAKQSTARAAVAGSSLGNAFGRAAYTSSLDDMARLVEQRRLIFGNEFGPPQGPVSPYPGPGGGQPEEPRRGFISRMRMGGRGAAMGAGMGLSMASMIPFMAQNEQGKFMGLDANIAGMGMMGAGGLLSMIGMVPGPLLAIAAAATAGGVALYAWRNSVDESARVASEFGSNIGGAANALNNMAAMMGKATPAQRQTQMRLGFTETEQEAAFGEFQDMFNTEEGQKFIEDLRDATSAERFSILSQYIKTAVASGLMEADVAPLFAKTVATALEDAFLGAAVVNSITKGIERGSAGLLDLARQREVAVSQNQAVQNVTDQDVASYQDSSTVIGASLQVIQDFSNAAALAKEEYNNGSISYEQYIAVLDEATEMQAKYSSALQDAVVKTSDLGATAQALDKQLGLLVSPDDLQKINDVIEIGTSTFENIFDPINRAIDTAIGSTLTAFAAPFIEDPITVDWAESMGGMTDEERRQIETQTKAFMAEAIVSGMNAATVAAIQQYVKENPESQAATAFEQYRGQGGAAAFRAAGLAANIEVLGLPGDLESIMTGEEYIEIAMKFMEEGGTVEDFEAFINSIPEEKAVDVMLAFKGMSPEDQMKFINSFQNLSNLIGSENAQRIDDILLRRAGATPTTVPVPGVPGATTSTTLGAQKSSIEQQLEQKRGVLSVQQISKPGGAPYTAEEQAAIDQTQAEIDALEAQLEEVTGKIYEIKMELDPKSQQAIEDAVEFRSWDQDTTTLIIEVLLQTEGDLENLPEYAEYASQLQQLPEEVRKILAIDTASLPDLKQFGPQTEALVEGVQLIDALPSDVDKELAFSMMVDENGKVKTPKQILSSTRNLQKDFKEIAKIPDSKLRKQMIFELMQQVTDETGQQITEDAFQQRYQELVSRYGQQVISNLPPDVLFKAIMFDYNADQLMAEAAAVRTAAARLANIGGAEAQVAKMLEEAAAMEAAASALSGMSGAAAASGAAANYGGSPPGGSGGGSGGGGGEDEDPLEAMMKDLQIQNKLIGDYNKKEGEVSRGFATALRRAGTPEYLIAEIVAKGKDGIEIAKKLLKDKQKKLKELMDLSLQVTRMTMIEQNRAAANNFRTQANAQNALFGAGIDPSTAIDIASDPQQAAAIADSYKRVQDAQKKLASAKGEGAKKKARKELQDAKKDWDQLTNSIKEATKAQTQFNIESGVKGQARVERKALGIQGGALTRLMTQGFTFEQAQGFAGDEMVAGAIVAAGRAADAAARRFAYLKKKQQELKEENKQGTPQWKRINKELREAREQADITSKKYKALIADLQALTAAQKANLVTNTIAEYKGLTGELGMQQNILQKLIDSGMSYAQAIEIASDPQRALAFAAALEKGEDVLAQMVAEAQALEAATAKFSLAMKMAEFGDARKKQGFLGAVTALTSGNPLGGMVTDYLMGLNTSELQEFFNQTSEWRQEFVQAFLDSLPLAEKIKYLFDQISAQQKYQSTLNRDKANLAKGDIENLDDQLKAQRKLLKAEQDKLKAVQKTIEVIQEENDDLNRGLDLISRQEEKINEAFDKRIEALDKVEQANARIAQQQQNQLNLSQALSSGDIYAATQAAQQIRQDNATAAIENTREALELAREEQLKNLTVEVNGELLTREQIEKRIESNNDRIYQIQEDQVEVIEAAIDSIQDQIDKVEDLKEAWQDYFDFLEENSKITIEVDGKKIDFTFKELQDMASRFNEIMALDEIGGDANKAFDRLIADLAKAGKALTADELKALRQYFGITATAPTTPTPGTPAPGTSTGAGTEGEEETDITTDVNAAKEAAILALPEIQKVMDAAKNIKKAIAETPAKIVLFTKSLTKNAQPVIDTTKEKANGILKKFKAIGTNIVDELIPNALTPLKDFLEGGLLTAVDSVVDAFNKINSQITKAIGGVATLATSLANLERNIVINITVNTTHTSSGSSGGSTTKPKKFMGGLIKMATGGMIPGGIPRDSVPILASPGEFVVRNAMVDKYGMSMLNDINQGSFEPSFRTPSGTSYTKINKPTEMNASSTMYNNNYSINVTANTNADADQIASATVMKIRQMNSMQIRGARG